ncbi:MAG: class I SAM-dependent methyltransferase [Candidatus Pacebacteria bacterium]|nr:class I SAM-dependent methyltransferase [Candidatus Paceibacterota bacterium]
MKKNEFNSEFWEKYFKVYDILNLCIPYIKLKEEFIKYTDPRSKDKILDAGGGTGNIGIELYRKGADVIILDFSKEALAICRQKETNIKTMHADLSEPLQFSDNFFDKIISNNVLYTIPKEKRNKIFKEFNRILKPGGKIIISNIKKGFNPAVIYKEHVFDSIFKDGFCKTFSIIFKMIYPTLKMFYYNSLIKKAEKHNKYSFLEQFDQEALLKNNRFKILLSKIIYANQAVISVAEKI